MEVSQTGTTEATATGKKDIGTPAKGIVTVFNSSDNQRTIAAGTTITSSNDLEFTLDKSVTVASASGDIFSVTTPGKANVNVTAVEIGTAGNLPSNTKFSFSADNSIAAKNDSAFSGGTKKSITVVSKEDIAKLESDLIKKLEEKARDEISSNISKEKILLPEFIKTNLSSKKFDKKEGDEANKISLSATANYQTFAYSKKDIASFIEDILKTAGNLTLDENRITTSAKDIKATGTTEVATTLTISGFLLPKINQEDLAKQISGKNIKDAQNLLTTIPQVESAIIKISPNIPLLPQNLPGVEKLKFTINFNE